MDWNPEKCPLGIKHEEQIDSTRKMVEIMVQRIEEKVDDLKDDVSKGFANVDERFNTLEDRFTNLKNNLPETIDDRIKHNEEKKAASVSKWVLVSLIGSTIILVFGRWVLLHLGL